MLYMYMSERKGYPWIDFLMIFYGLYYTFVHPFLSSGTQYISWSAFDLVIKIVLL